MKKEAKDWSIAIVHLITAGFVIPFLITITIGLGLVASGIYTESLTFTVFDEIVYSVSLWLGVMYSASYIFKTYTVNDASRIVKLSTIYRLVLVILFTVVGIFSAVIDSTTMVDVTEMSISIVFSIINMILFYVASKKYIKQNVTNDTNTNLSPQA